MKKFIIFLAVFFCFGEGFVFSLGTEYDHFRSQLVRLDKEIAAYRKKEGEHGTLFYQDEYNADQSTGTGITRGERKKLLRYEELLKFSWTLLPQEDRDEVSNSYPALKKEFINRSMTGDFGIGYEYLGLAEAENFYRQVDTYYNTHIRPLERKESLSPEELHDAALFYGLILHIQNKSYRRHEIVPDVNKGHYNFCGQSALNSPLFEKVLRAKPELLATLNEGELFLRNQNDEFSYLSQCRDLERTRGPMVVISRLKREEQERAAKELAARQRREQEENENLIAATPGATSPGTCPATPPSPRQKTGSLDRALERVEEVERELSGSPRPTVGDYARRATDENIRRGSRQEHRRPSTPEPNQPTISHKEPEADNSSWWDRAFCRGHRFRFCRHFKK